MAVVFKNNAKTTLASGINSSATSITVSDGDVFPSLTGSDIFFVTFDDGTNNEIVKVTARSGNTLTVVRAQESTTARSFSTGDEAQLRLTAGILGLFSQTGVAITDEIEAYLDANGTTFPDNVKAQFGASNDLQIYHDGTHSYVSDQGTGNLRVLAENFQVRNPANNEAMIIAIPDSGVTLYHDNASKLATTSSGVTVTGGLHVGTVTTGGNFTLDVGGDIIVDADGGDVIFKDDGTEIARFKGEKLGIGISPAEMLDIQSASGDARIRLDAPASSDTEIKFFNDGTAQYTIGHDDATDNFVIGGANVDAPLVSVNKSGVLTANAGVVVDNITIDGQEIDVSSGDLTVDVTGVLNLDATTQIILKDDGTNYGTFYQSSSDFYIQSLAQDKDIVFYGNDGGSGIAALTLDMSDAGTATFNHDIKLGDNGKVVFGASDDLQIYHDGNDSIISDEGTGGIKIFTAGVATSGFYKIGGEELATFEPDGPVTLYYNDIARLATTSSGVSVTGGLDVGTVTSTGNLVLNQDSGTIFIGADLDMRILHDGSNGTFRNDTGNLTVDVGGDIILDANGGDVTFKDDGTAFVQIRNQNPHVAFQSNISNGDIKFIGSDAGSDVTALTLDMSNAGAATFNSTISATSYSGALASTVTATTQSAGDNSTKVATTAYTDTAIANLADSAPSTLNTLNELAAALGDDANFSTTVTNSIATKLPLAGGTMTGALNMGANQITNSGKITSTELTITGGSDSEDIYINNTSPTLGFTDSNSFSDSNDVYLIRGASTGKLQFQFKDDSAGTTTQTFLIDQSGNADIAGTISSGAITTTGFFNINAAHTVYAGLVHTTSTATTSYNVIRFTQGSGSGAPTGLIGTAGSAVGNTAFRSGMNIGTQTSGSLNFIINDSYAGKFDTGGRLLIGTTSTTPAFSTGNGHAFHVGDASHISRSGGTTLIVNRGSSDGNIVDFRKDGTQVGVIGTVAGSLAVGGGDVFLEFNATSNVIQPMSTVTGGASNGLVDLGASLRKFKDLHLAGDIFLPYGSINDSGTDLVIHGTNAVVLKTDGGTALTIPNNSTDINLGSGKLNFSRTSEAILLDSAHSKTKIGLFGGIGTGAEYIGTSANTVEISGTNINFNGASGSGTPNLKMGTTTVIDSSRNLTNIGTITASGDITTADRIISKESSGGFYKLHTDGTFRAAFYDDNGNTQIYADGDGSNPFITFSGGATHTTDIDGILNLSNTNASLRIGGTEVISTGRNIANIGTISSGNITASGSSGAVITAEHNGGGVANDDFIGGFIFKNNDSSGTEPHYAGITARAHNIYGAMGLEFFADRADYENDTPAMALSPDGTDSSLNTLDLLSATKIQGITSISSGAITTTGHIQQNNANEIRSKDTGGSVRTIMRVNSSNELEYGWSGNGKVKIMGGGSYTERFSIGTDGNATFAGSISSVNDITIPSSSGGDGFIKLGSYLNIYGRNRSNTAAITINTTYDGAELNTYTPIYSGAASAGQFIMKQESGGHGTVDVFVKTHGTNSASAGISTFTQVAQFNDAGYFDASNGLYVNGTSVISSSRNLTNIQRINTADGINDAGTAGSSTIFNENGTTADFRVESTDNTHMLFVDGGLNRVGINRSSPNTTLHVNSGSTNINTRLESTDTAVILQLKDTTGIAAIESRNDFRFKVDTSTERMRLKNGGDLNLISGAYQINGTSVIDSSRNLTNIGTATAANFVGTGSYHEIGNNTGAVSNDGSWNARLNISGTSHARLDLFEDADNSLLRLYVHHGQSAHVGTTSSTDLVFETNDSARFKADASGLNIVSGHSIRHNSTTVLDSSRNLSNIASLGVGGSAGTQYPGFFQSGQRYLIGIKNTASGVDGNYPWLVHDNSNSMAALIVHFNGVGDRMTLREDGNAIFTGDVTAFSDERLKDNIQTLDGKKALQMRGVSYIRDGKEGSGVIAQEIEKIAPELVLTADDEQGTKSVAYGNLVGYLIEAIKEQQDQIEYMKSEIKVLKEANNGNK